LWSAKRERTRVDECKPLSLKSRIEGGEERVPLKASGLKRSLGKKIPKALGLATKRPMWPGEINGGKTRSSFIKNNEKKTHGQAKKNQTSSWRVRDCNSEQKRSLTARAGDGEKLGNSTSLTREECYEKFFVGA